MRTRQGEVTGLALHHTEKEYYRKQPNPLTDLRIRFRFLVLCTYKPETLTVRAGINLPKSSPGDVLYNTKSHSGSVEPYDDLDYNELQPARLEARKEEGQSSTYDSTKNLELKTLFLGIRPKLLCLYVRPSSALQSDL